VLPGRFVKLAFEQCFLGREDVTLKAKLRAELPGIAQRAVRAYRAAKARGRLIQPEAGLALRAEVDANADPFTRFVGEWIAVDGNATVRCGEVWTKFELWCAKTGNGGLLRSISDGSKLTKKLKKVPGLASLSSTSNHPREYIGLRLKTKEERQG